MGVVDIENAQATIRKTLENEQLALTQSELDRAYQLLKDYGEKRDNLQRAMLLLLGQYEPGSLDSDWRDCCSNGRDALNNLNSAMPPNGGGLNGVGLANFYRGESS